MKDDLNVLNMEDYLFFLNGRRPQIFENIRKKDDLNFINVRQLQGDVTSNVCLVLSFIVFRFWFGNNGFGLGLLLYQISKGSTKPGIDLSTKGS
jgi:hypothetical protein